MNNPENTAKPITFLDSAPAPAALTNGRTPRMNANEVIKYRTQTKLGSIHSSSSDIHSFFLFHLCKLNYKYCIFRCQSYESNKSDLSKNIIDIAFTEKSANP